MKVRLAFPNPDGDLKPEMFGEVVLQGEPRQGLRMPQDAVIDSGTEKIVFVALGAGRFQPRQVRLGEASGSDVEVVSGLRAGEQVVTRANFLIDSESRLRASLEDMAAKNNAKVPERARVLPGDRTSDEESTSPGSSKREAPAPAPAPPPAPHRGHRR